MALKELAVDARIAQEVLTAFEGGGEDITASELERISDVLAVDAAALRRGQIEPRPTAALFFRQGAFPDFRDDADRPKIAEVFERALSLVEVNRILGRPQGLRRKFEPQRPTPNPDEEGYRLARLVRGELRNRAAEMPDLTTLLEDSFDILVRTESLTSGHIDAISLKEAQTGAAAVVLNASSGRRSNPLTARVELAHELGHILFDPADNEINLIIDDDREDDGRNETTRWCEQRARAFAAELLIPLEGLTHLLGKPTYEMSFVVANGFVGLVRQKFRTPIEIAVNHLVNREYIDPALREAVIERSRAQADAATADSPAVESRYDVLERRVMEALERDLISRQRARELLQLSAWDDLPSTTPARE